MKYDVFLCVLLINNCGVHSRPSTRFLCVLLINNCGVHSRPSAGFPIPMCVVNKQLWRAQQAFNAVLQVSSNGCTCMQVCACSGVDIGVE